MPSVSHDRASESPEAKARWFQSLTLAERMDYLCAVTDLALGAHPELAEPGLPLRIVGEWGAPHPVAFLAPVGEGAFGNLRRGVGGSRADGRLRIKQLLRGAGPARWLAATGLTPGGRPLGTSGRSESFEVACPGLLSG